MPPSKKMPSSVTGKCKKQTHEKCKRTESISSPCKKKITSKKCIRPKSKLFVPRISDERLNHHLMVHGLAYNAKLEYGAKIYKILQCRPEVLPDALTPSDTEAVELFLSTFPDGWLIYEPDEKL